MHTRSGMHAGNAHIYTLNRGDSIEQRIYINMTSCFSPHLDEIFEAFIKLLIYLFIHLVSQSVMFFFMAEKLSVISLSYQMVEGLINNFKSNNWRAGQIHRHKHMHTLLAAYAKSPAQAQMHVIHTCFFNS